MRSISFGLFSRLFLGACPVAVLILAGCGDSQIKTYRIAKEDNTQKAAAPAEPEGHEHMHGMNGGAPAVPSLSWTTPTGWKELQPDGMRKAAFQIIGDSGKQAQVMVIPLPGASNIELESVNMWREELGLQPLNRDQVDGQGQPVEVGGSKGRLFEMVNDAPKEGQKFKSRTVGAIAEKDGVLWFVKMTGADDLVTQQKPAFVNFLNSLKFTGAQPAQVAAAEAPISTNAKRLPADADAPKWDVPANWQQKPAGPMVHTAYSVSGPEGLADVTVTKLSGTAGGLAGNVNRWRGQLGLPPLPEDEVQNTTQMIEIDGKKDSYLIDIKGTNMRTGKAARMVAVGVPRGGETWFYKLMGDDAEVAKEKDAFLKFIVKAY